jgi:hypothetical protein
LGLVALAVLLQTAQTDQIPYLALLQLQLAVVVVELPTEFLAALEEEAQGLQY